MDEIEKIKSRYDKRKIRNMDNAYSFFNMYARRSSREKEDLMIKLLKKFVLKKISYKKLTVLEIGCGCGNNLLDFIRWGFDPKNIVGNELLVDRVKVARKRLPDTVKIIQGDASRISEEKKFDIVFQSTVFTSILDQELKSRIADKMWKLVNRGGCILWYDFIYNNPNNRDVKGVSVKEIKKLFPHGEIFIKKVTLAPPLGRFLLDKLQLPLLYNILNLCPYFKTHVVAIIVKK